MAKAPHLEIDEGKLKAQLRRAVEAREQRATARVFDAGEDVERDVQSNAPVLTGELEGSIEIEKTQGRNGPEAIIRVKADHAIPQEFGSSHNPPQPFFRPAMAKARDLLQRRSRRR